MKTARVITACVAVSVMAFVSVDARAAAAQPAGCTVSLQPSAPSPLLVGERMSWTATAANCGAAPVYQFDIDARTEGRDQSGSAPGTPRIRDGMGLQPSTTRPSGR